MVEYAPLYKLEMAKDPHRHSKLQINVSTTAANDDSGGSVSHNASM